MVKQRPWKYCDFKSRTTNQSYRYVITVEMLSTCRYTTTSYARELNLPNQEKNEKTHFLFFAPTINLLWETNARVILLEDIHKVTTPVRVLRWFQMIVVCSSRVGIVILFTCRMPLSNAVLSDPGYTHTSFHRLKAKFSR